jgi:hypothetical protein
MKIDAKGKTELERFNNTMKELLAVSHDEIKAKLEAENAEKRKKSKKSSASHAKDDRA